MATATFSGTVLSGHKEDAVEVPFDPAVKLGAKKVSVSPKRLGFPLAASLNGHSFAGIVVGRSSRFWLLLPVEIERAASIGVGSKVKVSLSAHASGAGKP